MRRALFATLALCIFWFGCNGLLGIDDATFVPIDDGGASTESSTTPPSNGEGGLAPDADADAPPPLIATRKTYRIPQGLTNTFTVRLNPPAGTVGQFAIAIDGATGAVTPDIKTTADAKRFLVQVKAPDTPVDQEWTIRASVEGTPLGEAKVRVLVGALHSVDTSLGDGGGVGSDLPLSDAVDAFGAHDGQPVFVDDRGRLAAVDDDGSYRVLAHTPEGCTSDLLSIEGSRAFFDVLCGVNGDIMVGEADLDGTDVLVQGTKAPQPINDLLVVGGSKIVWRDTSDATFDTEVSDGTKTLAVAASLPGRLVPLASGGIAVVANSNDDLTRVLVDRVVLPAFTASNVSSSSALFNVNTDSDSMFAIAAARFDNDDIAIIADYAENGFEHVVLLSQTAGNFGFTEPVELANTFNAFLARGKDGQVYLLDVPLGSSQTHIRRLLPGPVRIDTGYAIALPQCAATAQFFVDDDGLLVVVCTDAGTHLQRFWP